MAGSIPDPGSGNQVDQDFTNVEPNETFKVTLSNPQLHVSATQVIPGNIGGTGVGTGTIVNDDSNTVSLAISNVSQLEGNTQAPTNLMTFPVTLTGLLSKAGPNLLTAKIGEGGKDAAIPGQPVPVSTPDDLPGDNRFDKIILVRDRVKVLLIDGNRDPRDPKDSAGHFIKNALVPVPEINRPDYFIRVTDVTPNEATPALLNDADLCILANVPASDRDLNGIPGLSPAFASRLKTFVSEGHGLIIGAGDFTKPQGYNEVLKPLGLLPFDGRSLLLRQSIRKSLCYHRLVGSELVSRCGSRHLKLFCRILSATI